jgi:hypothetical protein
MALMGLITAAGLLIPAAAAQASTGAPARTPAAVRTDGHTAPPAILPPGARRVTFAHRNAPPPRFVHAGLMPDAPVAIPAVTAATCSFTFSLYKGPTGHFLCGTYVRGFLLPGTAIYAFGIGTDKAVWRAYSPGDGYGHWLPSSPWASMGGVAINGTWAWTDLSYNAAVQVRGTDSNLWCRYWPFQGSWGSWFMCNGWKANGSEITFAHG